MKLANDLDKQIRAHVVEVLSSIGFFETEPVWGSLGLTKDELDAELELGQKSGSSGLSHCEVFARYGI